MNERERAALAIGFLQDCQDVDFLQELVRRVAPRARKMSTAIAQQSGEENVPGPADIAPAAGGSREDADAAVDLTTDFAVLQAVARAAGRRLEYLRKQNGASPA